MIDSAERMREQFSRYSDRVWGEQQSSDKSVEPMGSPPYDGGMDDLPRRVGVLETKMDRVQDTLTAIQIMLAEIKATMVTKADLEAVKIDVAELKGRVAKLPSLAQIGSLIALAAAVLKGLAILHI